MGYKVPLTQSFLSLSTGLPVSVPLGSFCHSHSDCLFLLLKKKKYIKAVSHFWDFAYGTIYLAHFPISWHG